MEYMDVRRAAELWQMPERKVTSLCREGRIPGAKKEGKLWQIPAGSLRPLDARTREYAASRQEPETACAPDAGGRAVQAFRETYHKEPETTAFTPYRVCLIGAHSDHNLGKVTGMAIDKGIHIACGPKQNGVVEIRSLQFPKRAQWHVTSTPPVKQNDWADHLRGATIALAQRFPLHVGLCAVLDGELPIGGLSSSAAVIISFLSVLCRLNGIRLGPEELIQISLEAENRYVGVACGKLDQSCEVYRRVLQRHGAEPGRDPVQHAGGRGPGRRLQPEGLRGPALREDRGDQPAGGAGGGFPPVSGPPAGELCPPGGALVRGIPQGGGGSRGLAPGRSGGIRTAQLSERPQQHRQLADRLAGADPPL